MSSSSKRRYNVNLFSTNRLSKSKRRRTKSPVRVADNSAQDADSEPQAKLNCGLVNPTLTAITDVVSRCEAFLPGETEVPKRDVVSKIRGAMKVLLKGCGICPPLQQAARTLLETLDSLTNAAQNDENFEEASGLLQRAVIISGYISGTQQQPELMSRRIHELANVIKQQADRMSRLPQHSPLARFRGSEEYSESLRSSCREIESAFSQLQMDANLETWRLGDEGSKNSYLKELSPSHDARHDSAFSSKIEREGCYPNTQTILLDSIFHWACDLTKAILHIVGMPGTGKTSIVYSICEILERNGRLGASFFCSHLSPDCQDPSRIIPTIAYQLAHRFYPFKSVLCRILSGAPDLARRKVEIQFEQLIRIPLMEVEEILPRCFTIVIDALEETSDRRTTKRILDILIENARSLPIKVLITSRPDFAAVSPSPISDESYRMLSLHDVDKRQLDESIKTFLSIKLLHQQLSEKDLDRLVEQCGGSFVFAAIVAKYISPNEPGADTAARLAAALGQRLMGYGQMEDLYKAILGPLLLFDDKQSVDRVIEAERMNSKQSFLTVLGAMESPSEPVLIALTGNRKSWSSLQPFRSVLHISEDRGAVSTIHNSLSEFIFRVQRSGPLACDKEALNAHLAKQCFVIMSEQLKYNIGKFKTQHLSDKDVPQLETILQEAIKPDLSYACRFCFEHLRRSKTSEELLTYLYEFLGKRFLFWMEVMNLMGRMSSVPQMLKGVQEWVLTAGFQHVERQDKTSKFLQDAHNFATTFAAGPACQSTMHIYSSLEFAPSEVKRYYSEFVNNPIQLRGTILKQREGAALATRVIGAGVSALAHSLGAMLIAAGTTDGDVHISSVYDGAGLLSSSKFKAHSQEVTSLTFSHDNSLIISASRDCTIGIWKVGGDVELRARLREHKLPVNSVAIAHNGAYFASGADDRIIRLWDIHNKFAPARLLSGHDSPVTSVQISLDSKKLVSGSQNGTVRVWDVSTTSQLGNALRGHEGCVTSVLFSIDGERVISASLDRTIRLWDIKDGRALFNLFEEHSDRIHSIALSHDGNRIISGGQDGELTMWDSHHGHRIGTGRLFDGRHTRSITSITFLQDDTHAISSSLDGTVKLWNTCYSRIFNKSSQGHTNGIDTIAVSGDGAFVASGSLDHAIYVWSLPDGILTLGPLVGHQSPVTSIVFMHEQTPLRLVSGSKDCTVCVWNLYDGALLYKIAYDSQVNSVAISPNDTLIASGLDDRTIRLSKIQNRTQFRKPLIGHNKSVTSLSFASNGRLLVSGSWDQTVRVWDVDDCIQIAGPFCAHSDVVSAVLFSPNCDHIFSGSWDGRVRVWCWENGTPSATMFEGHSNRITSLAISTDGSCLVSSSRDCQIRIWDVPSQRLLGIPLNSHTDSVTSVSFLPNERRFVSASLDQTIRIWDVPDSNEGCAWAINPLGWMVEHPSQFVLHLPADLRDIVPRPPNVLTIYPHGSIGLSSHNVSLNEIWRGPNASHQTTEDLTSATDSLVFPQLDPFVPSSL